MKKNTQYQYIKRCSMFCKLMDDGTYCVETCSDDLSVTSSLSNDIHSEQQMQESQSVS
ncbi:MAG: hypothetical protein ISR96_11015 [Nitrospira sp.]|nr:hypothetical protein [Nitrospira sp.]